MKLSINRNSHEGFTTFELIALFLYFMVEINVELFVHRPLYIAIVVLTYLALLMNMHGRFKTSMYFLWTVGWSLAIALSLLYSINRSYTFTALLTVLSRGILFTLLISRINNYNQVVRLLKLFIFCAILNTLYILYRVDVTTLGVSRIGARTIESDVTWNSNSIGTLLAFSVFVIILLLVRKQYQGPMRSFMILVTIGFSIIILLCGSRVALLLVLVLPLLYYLLTSNVRNGIKRILFIALALVGTFWILINITPVYNVLGSRIERLVYNILGISTTVDGSISSRNMLIRYGMEWFKESPIWGFGMYTFMQKSAAITYYAWYAHNNYLEIAVGLGVIGLVIYYWYYIYILRNAFRDKSHNGRLVLSTIIVILIAEYGTVAFKSFIYQFAICLLSIMITLSKQQVNENGAISNE